MLPRMLPQRSVFTSFSSFFLVVLLLVATVALAFASFQQSERPASFHIQRSLFTDTQRDDKMLQFKPDGTFKIVQFTDLHMGENDTSGVYDAAQDMRTMEVMERVLSSEPDIDLVLLTGDMLSGWFWDGKPGWVQKHWSRVLSAIERHKLPYAFINGNHDSQADLTRRQVAEFDATHPLSLTQVGPDDVVGATNYHLTICSSTSSSSASSDSSNSSSSSGCVPAARLWMLDTLTVGECGPSQLRSCCEATVPEWLHKEAIPKGATAPLPGVAFVHIPMPEFMSAWDQKATWGHKFEKVSCYPQSGCLFPALKAAGVTAVYSGHDHDNNYYADYDGVRLAYGAKTGYGTYGPAPGWLRGARLIVLREGQRFSHSETWLRFEDGTRMVQPPTEGKWLWHWMQWMLPSFYAQKVCNY